MLSKIKNLISSVKCKIGNNEQKPCCMKSCALFTLKVSLTSLLSVAIVYFPLKGKIIEDMLLSNPKSIIKAVEKMREGEQKKSEEESKKKLPEITQQITSNSNIPAIGNSSAKNTIILFYDINCGYCKKELIELTSLTQSRQDIKVLLVDFPVLSEQSFLASQVMLHVNMNYRNSFSKLLNFLSKAQKVDQQTLALGLKNANLPSSVIENAKKDQAVIGMLRGHHEYGRALGIQGTPVVIVNGKLIPGYAPIDNILANL